MAAASAADSDHGRVRQGAALMGCFCVSSAEQDLTIQLDAPAARPAWRGPLMITGCPAPRPGSPERPPHSAPSGVLGQVEDDLTRGGNSAALPSAATRWMALPPHRAKGRLRLPPASPCARPRRGARCQPLGRVDKRDSQSAIIMIQGWNLGASHDPRPDRHRSLGADRPVSAA